MQKILILGAKGMLAQDLLKIFSNYQIVAWDIEDINIIEKQEVFLKINKIRPKIIINAAAYTDVDGAEKNKKLVFAVNAAAIKYLVEIARKTNALLVHYSTDYVFPGRKRQGYKENDIPTNPINIYGQSKLMGEKNIPNSRFQIPDSKFYLIRTSWLFGPSQKLGKHKNFVNAILNLAKEKESLKVVNDQFGFPTYTLDLAKTTKQIIEKNMPYGIYHVTNSGRATWYKFAKEIIKLAGLKTKILPCQTSDFPRPAKRPKYSFLINTKLPKARSWRKALRDYLNNL